MDISLSRSTTNEHPLIEYRRSMDMQKLLVLEEAGEFNQGDAEYV